MTRIPNPCSRDCPERSATCHGTCEKYFAFDEANRKLRKWRIDYVTINTPGPALEQNIRRKLRQKK